jgi:RNA polymerase sigma factor (sigma-70 family)
MSRSLKQKDEGDPLLRIGSRAGEKLILGRRNSMTTSYGLLTRLENWKDEKSWKDFFDRYSRLIYSLAIRAGLTEAEADDVVQETVVCVAKDIHKFQCSREQGSFKGWLRNLTRWRIADQLRKRNHFADPSGNGPDSSALEEIPDGANVVESLWDEEWQMNLLETAIERVKRRVSEEHFQMFDLYVMKCWPVTKVARRLDVSVGSVYVAKHRISALLKKEIQLLEDQLL